MKMLLRTLFLLFFLAVTLQAQQTGLSGKVVDSMGATISGALVEVRKIGAAAFIQRQQMKAYGCCHR